MRAVIEGILPLDTPENIAKYGEEFCRPATGFTGMRSYRDGEWLKVGEYINQSFELLDLEKITVKIIRFTTTLYHERNFWLAALSNTEELAALRQTISDGKCWDAILAEARRCREPLLAGTYMPAVRQAIEVMLDE